MADQSQHIIAILNNNFIGNDFCNLVSAGVRSFYFHILNSVSLLEIRVNDGCWGGLNGVTFKYVKK